MDVWLSFAYISEGEVKNVVCYLYTGYTEASDHAKTFCGDENAIAVDVTHIPVQIGDTYSNGKFYRVTEGIKTEIIPLPSVSEAVASNAEAIENILIAITPQTEA